MQHDATQYACGKLRQAVFVFTATGGQDYRLRWRSTSDAVAIECRICDAGVTFKFPESSIPPLGVGL